MTRGGGGKRVTRTKELGGREVITDDPGGGGRGSHEPRSWVGWRCRERLLRVTRGGGGSHTNRGVGGGVEVQREVITGDRGGGGGSHEPRSWVGGREVITDDPGGGGGEGHTNRGVGGWGQSGYYG